MTHDNLQLAINIFAFIGLMCTVWTIVIFVCIALFKKDYDDGAPECEINGGNHENECN